MVLLEYNTEPANAMGEATSSANATTATAMIAELRKVFM
jgi:hypothetical protein